MKCDVLYVITRGDDIGGANIHVRDMSLWMKNKGFDVVVLTGTKGIFNDCLDKLGIKNLSTNYLKRNIDLFSDVLFIFWFYKFSLKLKPKLVSAHSSKAGILCRVTSRLFKVAPCIFTAHGWSFTEGIDYFSRKFYLFIEKITGKFTDQIITVCKSDLYMGLNYNVIPKKKITCIHNGMYDIKTNKIKRYPKDKLVFISVARFDTQKDHETLIKAFSLIKDLNWELILVGSGPTKKKSIEFSKVSGINSKIVFMGRSDNVASLLEKADIFILSSLWEGFPRSILEAMRASMPVIATDVGGVKESVINNVNGFTFKRKQYLELAYHLKFFINNQEKITIFGKNSRDLFKDKFIFEKTALKTNEVYKKFL